MPLPAGVSMSRKVPVTVKLPDLDPLAQRFLCARVSAPPARNSPALFACERVSERPSQPPSRPPLALSTTTVTDASFPLHFRAKRAQSAVGYVRPKRVTKPDGLAALSKLYRALARYIDNVTSPNLEKFRHYLDEK